MCDCDCGWSVVSQPLIHCKNINKQYAKLAFLSNQMLNNMKAFNKAQTGFGEFLYKTGIKETEPIGESMQALGVLHRNFEVPGKNLINSLNQMVDVIHTFRTAVIEDALYSVKKTEEARIHWTTMQESMSKQLTSYKTEEVEMAKKIVGESKDDYDRLRGDLETKFVLLNEKRVQELSAQLLLLAHAWSSYYIEMASATEQKIVIAVHHTREFKDLMGI
eukprot:TRINITY_DN6137_c0_g1_i2.p1 TRINITY_DN6137_c0_g1~~TRINITY_DN6137_c0_g1_i2.p1  ORF type:complete len:219 (-),score=53.54 TRINITY_DN6137_c0_g1_i2:38-694(-)